MSTGYAFTMNGRIHGELKETWAPAAEEIRRRVALLDGTERFSLSLWRLPPGVDLDRVKLDRWPQEYIQTAGCRDRLTVEVRRLEAGVLCQDVVGRGGEGADGPRDQAVRWSVHETVVAATELYTTAEAGDLFVAYYESGRVPSSCHLRRLAP